MQVRSYAKINWALRILGRRGDGYHDLETLFQTISLHDVLTLRPADRLVLTCDDASIPADDTNLVVRAARAIGAPPVAIHLQKRIPAGGGLGGGSSNAAAALLALDEMFGLRTPRERLDQIALTLGSDVPFFLSGGAAYGRGRGEELTPMPARSIPLLVLLPDERVSTAEAFSRVRRYSAPLGIDAYRGLDPNVLINDFEDPIFAMLPRLGELKQRLRGAGAWWAGMSGSGSAIVGAFRSVSARDAAVESFRDERAAAAESLAG
jgi:4-diphosphocytidyl-2-C-methyl-D-erythritol kinase